MRVLISLVRPLPALLSLLVAPLAWTQAVPHPFTFSPLMGVLPPIVDGTARWGDLDGDGDMDLVLMGTEPAGPQNSVARARTYVVRNEGVMKEESAPGGLSMRFAFEFANGLPALTFGDAALADYDRDGDLDVLLTGSRTVSRPYTPATRLMRNTGGTFTDTGLTLPALHSGSARWADLDRDGDLDLVLCGTPDAEGPYSGLTFVLLQGPDGTFGARTDNGLPGLVFGHIRLADLDGDGIPDFTGEGLTATGPLLVSYRNDGTGRFTLIRQIPGGVHADVEVADFNGDRTLDLVDAGVRPGPFVLAGTMRRLNTTGTTFAVRQHIAREGLGARLAAGDYTGDGRPDLAAMIAAIRPDRATVGAYTVIADSLALQARLLGDFGGVLAWGDADGDGDLDLVASYNAGGAPQLILYRNERFDRSQPPPVPAATPVLARSPEGNLQLQWAPPPGASSVTYDVRIGTTPGGAEIRAAEADLAGHRLQSALGPLAAPVLGLAGLLAGTYYVGLQTIGADFAGSGFAEHRIEFSASTGVAPFEAGHLALDLSSPTRTHMTVRYQTPRLDPLRATVFDALGRRVQELSLAPSLTETQRVVETAVLPAGLYVLRVEQGAATISRPFLVIR